jgi:hypothetical protein
VGNVASQTGELAGKITTETASFVANTASQTGEAIGQATTSTLNAVGNVASQTGELAGKITTETASFVANTASQTGEAIGQATTNTVHFASEAGHIVTNIAGDALSGAAKGTSVVAFWTLSQLAEGLMDGVKSSFASGFGLPAFCLLLGLIFIYRFVFKRSSKKVVYSYLGQSDTSSVINDSSLIETPENDVTR